MIRDPAVTTAAPRTGCPVCGAQDRRPVPDRAASASILECAGCGVWSVHPQPSIESLRELYSDDYYAPWKSQERARRKIWDRRMRFLHGVPRGRLMDVGCADGAFMQRARKAGFCVMGTEFSPIAAARTSHWLNLPVYTGELQEVPVEAGSLRVITLWHVLEHTTLPGETLAAARRLLAGDGILIVAVPNRRNPAFRALYRLGRFRTPHLYHPGDREQHLHHWEPRTLRSALEHHGFRILELRPDRCALTFGKRMADLLGRVHTAFAREPRTSAMVALACPASGPKDPEGGDR